MEYTFYRRLRTMDSFRPEVYLITKQTNKFVTLTRVECDTEEINIAISIYTPTNIFQSPIQNIITSKKNMEAYYRIVTEPFIYDSGYAVWSDDDYKKWNQYKNNKK